MCGGTDLTVILNGTVYEVNVPPGCRSVILQWSLEGEEQDPEFLAPEYGSGWGRLEFSEVQMGS